MPVKKELQKIDKVNISTIFQRRKDLQSIDAVARAIGETSDVLISAMLQPYAERLGVSMAVLEQSLHALLGRCPNDYPTLRDCRKADWILAANVDMMRQGHPVEPFTKIYRREWTPMVIVDGYEDYTSFGTAGTTYVLMSMGGYTATEDFKNFVPKKGGRWFVHTTMLGLPGTKYRFYQPVEERQPIDAPRIYVGMYTWALIEPGCQFGAPFERAECTPGFEQHNRKLLSSRYSPCPMEFDCTCTTCTFGMERCERGTHRGMYVKRHCAHCHSMSMFREAESIETVCLECRHTLFLSRKRGAARHRKDNDGHERETKGSGALVQPASGSAERVAGNADEGGGIRSGPTVQYQPVAGDAGLQGGCDGSAAQPVEADHHGDQGGQVSKA